MLSQLHLIMSGSGRQYDVVLYGATGYTGRLTASSMAVHLPTDTKWAIAGRSASKLEAIATACKTLNPDRIQPGKVEFNLDCLVFAGQERINHD